MDSPLLLKLFSTLVISFLVFYGSVITSIQNSFKKIESSSFSLKNNATNWGDSIKKEKLLSPALEGEKTSDKPSIENTTISPPTLPLTSTTTHTTIETKEVETAIDYEENGSNTNIQNPCDEPIHYKIGSFDPRFNISKNYFLEKLKESASLWNNAVGKELFIYDKDASPSSTSINLIYDERQAKTDANKLTGAEINNTKDAALSLKKEYEAMNALFLEHKDIYLRRVDTFNTRQKTYNESVSSWNEKGGAPKSTYDELMAEKASLEQESTSLLMLQKDLSTELASINKKIDRYNELVTFANEKVTVNNSASRTKFTEGIYSTKDNKIIIYQFANDIKLSRVLTHELGHALGIDHTKDKNSIMYSINNATTTYLGFEDVQAIKNICTK